VYVIELSKRVFSENARFRAANPICSTLKVIALPPSGSILTTCVLLIHHATNSRIPITINNAIPCALPPSVVKKTAAAATKDGIAPTSAMNQLVNRFSTELMFSRKIVFW
jgi:hypothetical protein